MIDLSAGRKGNVDRCNSCCYRCGSFEYCVEQLAARLLQRIVLLSAKYTNLLHCKLVPFPSFSEIRYRKIINEVNS